MVDSPVAVVSESSGFAARTTHHTPQTDPDLNLFNKLADARDFDALTQLCRERLLMARDGLASLRWTKDRAIVEAMKGDFIAAYDLLASAHWLAQGVEGVPRGKYELEFGIVHARLGRSSLALDRFNLSFQHYRKGGRVEGCARVDTARARALMTRGEVQKAMRYIRRALDYARANNDFRLELEICETVVEFGGVL